MTITSSLAAYPLATFSAAAFYLILIAAALPVSGRYLKPYILNPVAARHGEIASFDTIRGLAAAIVAVAHSWYFTWPVFSPLQYSANNFFAYPLGHGYKAVPIFCVLSGFLIYRSVLQIRSIGDLQAYCIRRFFRIYPVYGLGVLLAAATGQYLASANFPAWSYFIADLAMAHLYGWTEFANPAMWSVYAEVMFYVALPLIVCNFGRKHIVAVAVLLLLLNIAIEYPSRLFGLWKYFIFGILAAELSGRTRTLRVPLFTIGFALVVVDFWGKDYDWVLALGLSRRTDGQTYGLGIGCALVLATLPHLTTLSRLLAVFPLRMLGAISFSLYVTHLFFIRANFPALGVLNAFPGQDSSLYTNVPLMPAWYPLLVFFPGMLFCATVSYVLVERPGLMFGRWLALRRGKRGVQQFEPQP